MKKPSKIKSITAKKTNWLWSSFRAITLFGVVYCQTEKDKELINKSDSIDSELKCHETIHLKQAVDTHDSWLRFYANYIWQWVTNLPLIFIQMRYAYKFMPYELEAYAFEDDFNYPTKTANMWRVLNKKLKLKDKKKYAKEYKKLRKEQFVPFRTYIKNRILPKINGED